MSGKLNGRVLSDADVKAIAVALADELEARAQRVASKNRSGGRSTIGIGARGQGDPEWPENERSEYMDPTIEEPESSDGESSSPQQMAAKLLNRSRQRQRLKRLPTQLAHKPKAAR